MQRTKEKSSIKIHLVRHQDKSTFPNLNAHRLFLNMFTLVDMTNSEGTNITELLISDTEINQNSKFVWLSLVLIINDGPSDVQPFKTFFSLTENHYNYYLSISSE